MKIKSITIYNPTSEAFFVNGEKVEINGKETDITVDKISYFFGKAKVFLSNGEVLIYISNNLKIVK